MEESNQAIIERRREWKHLPPGSSSLRYGKQLFAEFLERYGITAGTPPKLPDYCIEEPEEGFSRLVAMGIEKYTYFARGKWTGRIKIGKSNNPWRRVHELINANFGEEAELVATLRGSHFESVYHEVFREWHEGHEWFAPHPDILAEIERLNAGAAIPRQRNAALSMNESELRYA